MRSDDRQGYRGRGVQLNTVNRFNELAIDLDPAEVTEDDRRVRTRYLDDTSRSVISTNSSPDLGFDATINPYRGCEHGCSYCYARPTHEYLGLSAGLDFERVIMVKRDAPALLEEKLRAASWQPRVLMLSGVTDPYQPVERRLALTRSTLSVLARFKNPVAMITKNALVTRDSDILADMAEWNGAVVTLSITTLDEQLRAKLEPRTSTIADRFVAMRRLADAGIPVGVNMAPIIPGLTDHEISELLARAGDAGATHANYTLLRLPGAVTDLFTQWLDDNVPLRKDKVLNRIREVHGGVLDDRQFGRRMGGTGTYANQLGDLFRLARLRAGIPERGRALNATEFQVPGQVTQGSLFGDAVL